MNSGRDLLWALRYQHLVLSSLLVDISLAVVGLLVNLVRDGITGSLGTGREVGVSVLGDLAIC